MGHAAGLLTGRAADGKTIAMTSSFTHASRRSMTPLRALKLFEECGGQCAACKRKLGPQDDWDVDHIIALENGGTDEDANCQILCDWCHKPKTADDHALSSKGKRMAAKRSVPRKFK